MPPPRIEDSMKRLWSEYLATPRLSLTLGEVARILNVDPSTARGLLHGLQASGFLERTRDGRFARVAPGSALHDCAACGKARACGTLLRVANTDETEAVWVCRDCQHKLAGRINAEGIQRA